MIPLSDEPILRDWLNPAHLETDRIAEDARARPHARYVVLDHFFRPEAAATLLDQCTSRFFTPDNVGLNYDSTSTEVITDEPLHNLLYSPAWVEWVHAALGVPQPDRSQLITAVRCHPPYSNGFWPHVDDFAGEPKRIAILIYLSDNWRAEDGGLLQFWQPRHPIHSEHNVLRWNDWLGRRLDFLNDVHEAVVELGGPGERPITRIRLVDQIVPVFNRAVLIALRPVPAIHSVTPSQGRIRYGILQWIC